MNFTHTQISELLLELANSENGTNLLMENAPVPLGTTQCFCCVPKGTLLNIEIIATNIECLTAHTLLSIYHSTNIECLTAHTLLPIYLCFYVLTKTFINYTQQIIFGSSPKLVES